MKNKILLTLLLLFVFIAMLSVSTQAQSYYAPIMSVKKDNIYNRCIAKPTWISYTIKHYLQYRKKRRLMTKRN
jgi:hypothetical protein